MHTANCRIVPVANNSNESTGAVQTAMAAFDAVNSPEDRTKVLQHIVKSLDRKERSDLERYVNGLHDPFNVLHPEIILQIMDHLPMYCTWDLRLVCRRWQEVLSSSMAIRAALKRWDTHDPSDSAGPTPNDTLISRVRHMQAMRLGRPFFVLQLDKGRTNRFGESFDIRQMCLKGPRLAYIQSGDDIEDRVTVRNLVSGDTFSVHSEGREKIFRFVLTSQLVAFTTGGAYLYVVDLSDPARKLKQVRIPSAPVSLSGDGDILVLLLSPWLLAPELPHTIAIYSHANKSLRSFAFEPQSLFLDDGESKMNPHEVIISSKQQTIDILSLSQETLRLADLWNSRLRNGVEETVYVGSMRFPLEIINTKDPPQPDVESHVPITKKAFMGGLNTILPIGQQGSMNFPMVDTQTPDITLSMPMTFNQDRGEIEGSCPTSSVERGYQPFCNAIQRWKDIYFDVRVGIFKTVTKPSVQDSSCRLWSEKRSAILFHGRHPGCEEDLRLGETPKRNSGFDSDPREVRKALVNDTFLIRWGRYEKHIEVYSFDENIRPHGSQSTGLWSDVATQEGHSPYVSLSGGKPYDEILADLRASHSEFGKYLPESSVLRDTTLYPNEFV